MSAPSSALSVPDLHSVVDDDFLPKVAEILERLRVQSEMRGYPLLASLLAITKGEAEDDLRTRARGFDRNRFLDDVDDGVIRMAKRLACVQQDRNDADELDGPAQLLSFIRA